MKPSSSPFLIAMLIQLQPTRPVTAVFLNGIRTLPCYRENANGDIVQWIQETCLVCEVHAIPRTKCDQVTGQLFAWIFSVAT